MNLRQPEGHDAEGAGMSGASLRQIDIDLLQPGRFQPRRDIPPEALAQLADSIKAEGVLQPILVRRLLGTVPQRYEIIAGERRWRAAQAAGLHCIPALVRPVEDSAALVQALVENLQREDLNPVDAARGVAQLIEEFQLTHDEAAQRLGRSREAITHLLRILQLAPEVLAAVAQGRLSLGHAKRLVGLPQPIQRQLAEEVEQHGLPVRALERRVLNHKAKRAQPPMEKPRRDPDIVRLEQQVGELIGAETRIDYIKEGGRGRIMFTFHSLEALDGILERLGYPP